MTGRTGGHPALSAERRPRHDALLFDSPEQLVAVAVPFLTDGLDAGDAAVIAARSDTAAVLWEALDHDPRVTVLDQDEVYRTRAATTIARYRRLTERRLGSPGSRVRVIGQVDHGTSERTWLEWQRYEAVVNQALGGWPLWALCLFDTARTPGPVLEAARHTHPHLATVAGRQVNPGFVPPADYLRSLPIPHEPVQHSAPRLWAADVSDAIALRHVVAGELATVDAPRDLIEDFLLAVDEMVSNAFRHGLPPVSLRLWIGTDRIVCVIGDGGQGWDDPFAGYGPAHGDDLSRGGMGLWLARQLCDHVDIDQDGRGVRVRLTTHLG